VNPVESVSLVALIVVLLGIAGYMTWRQVRALRGLAELPAEERPHQHRQARRRLFSSALMVVFAGMLIGYFFLYPTYREVTRQVEGRNQLENPPPLTPEQEQFLRLFTWYWSAAFLVLLLLVSLAVVDFWATARFGLRSHRRLQADHRAQLQAEVQRFRNRRDGNGEG